MSEKKEEMPSQESQNAAMPSSGDQPETSNRRQMILRYGKYAVVAAPLLMFVSKAHAIHSRP